MLIPAKNYTLSEPHGFESFSINTRKMKKLLFSLTILMVIGCFTNCANSNLSNSSPSPTITPEIVDINADTALANFLANNHKGWKKIGLSDTVEACSETESCTLHLQKDGKDKIITIVFRKLINENGHQYWIVYEATPYEVAKTRVDAIKEKGANEMVEEREMLTEMADDYRDRDQWDGIR